MTAWVARKTRLGAAESLLGGSSSLSDDTVVWLVAVRTEPPAATPEGGYSTPNISYPSFPAYPGPMNGGPFDGDGVLAVISASSGGFVEGFGLSNAGEEGVHYADVEAIADDPSLVVAGPTALPTVTPTEHCGPFVLCTPAGVLAVAQDPVTYLESADGGEVNFGPAAVRLVPWRTVESELTQMAELNLQDLLACGTPRPNQVVWVVAYPFDDSMPIDVVAGLLLFFSPANNYEMVGSTYLVADSSKGLSIDEVEAWRSEPMPAELDDAVPGCEELPY